VGRVATLAGCGRRVGETCSSLQSYGKSRPMIPRIRTRERGLGIVVSGDETERVSDQSGMEGDGHLLGRLGGEPLSLQLPPVPDESREEGPLQVLQESEETGEGFRRGRHRGLPARTPTRERGDGGSVDVP